MFMCMRNIFGFVFLWCGGKGVVLKLEVWGLGVGEGGIFEEIFLWGV